MQEPDKKHIEALIQSVEKLKLGIPSRIKLPKESEAISPEIRELSDAIQDLAFRQNERNQFLLALANGNLEEKPDYYKNLPGAIKQLHSDLMHLNWQTKQIISGDLSQKVSFMGEFSDSFNLMIQSLREMKQMDLDLKTANQTRDKLFSIISHDLRAPFNAILGFSEILSQENSHFEEEEFRALAVKIKESAQSTYVLLENLLKWAQMQGGKISPKPEVNRLKQIVKSVFKSYQANAELKKISLIDETKETDFFWADSRLALIILSNLINNAIKFSHQEGRILVSSQKSKTHIQIAVTDFGVGLPDKKRRTLFTTDLVESTRGTAMEKGSGLGLMLCREFVQLSGGEISVAENKPQGSIFSFSLPLFE
jgi:K+-sensing histidine kinase KdpD